MQLVSIVETYDEAKNMATELGLPFEGKEVYQLIREVNEMIVSNSISLPALPKVTEETLRHLEEGDLLTMREESSTSLIEYRILVKMTVRNKNYVVLVPVKDEKEPEYDVFFYRYKNGVKMYPLNSSEWEVVEKAYEEIVQLKITSATFK
ncbi:DUF1292 domain-containing protein [Paenibacillus sp. Leaf72]|uniref:DUF1292 domain-containing protein n=1 Tax=Paenibacillus sp. Leaf72 TaxID=1736234 RepID=UPI0006FFE4BD|nr:DUF1292 domain-containing protein [Paenibacillus sp. Leaf72]KQN96828.1 hypothetical protein ASF12_22410 [Paenibacillus sp. Leaf72]